MEDLCKAGHLYSQLIDSQDLNHTTTPMCQEAIVSPSESSCFELRRSMAREDSLQLPSALSGGH